MQRREFLDLGRAIDLEQVLDGSEDAAIARHVGGHITIDLEQSIAQHQCGQRIATDERPATPALTVLDRFEQEPGRVVTAETGERGDGRDEIGEKVAPHGNDGMVGRQFAESLTRRRREHGQSS